nr:serine/threonine-protein phosphatase 7 long form like [Quercus suber]
MAAVAVEEVDEFGLGPMDRLMLRFLKEHRSSAIWEGEVVWQPYKAKLAHLPAFYVTGKDVWSVRVSLVCFWLVEKHTLDRVVRQFGIVQEMPPNVDTDNALHAIDLRRMTKLIGGTKMLAISKVTWRFVDHTTAALLIMVANHKQMLACYAVISRPDPPPPPHASPTVEFPPPPNAYPSLEIPPCTAHVVPNLEIPLPTAYASSHPEIPSPTLRTFSDPAYLSITSPSFDLGFDFNETPPVMHTQSPLYSIGHIDHVPPYGHSMSFMPTLGLYTDPMTTSLTHISSAIPSLPAIVGSLVIGSQEK